jgi:hypothetical protein
MRAVALTLGLLGVLLASAQADEIVCSPAPPRVWAPNSMEWVERGAGYDLRAARIVARNPNWKMDDDDASHAMGNAECSSCGDDRIRSANFWLGVGPNNLSIDALEQKITAEAIAEHLRYPPFGLADVKFSAASSSVQASIGELGGRARLIGIAGRGQSGEVIALAVAKGCLFVVGVLSAQGPKIGLDQLEAFGQAIGVEFYKPAPIPVAPLTGPPLGDRFRPEDWEKR